MSQPKPNILLITTDQQRYDTAAGPAKPSFMRTPHFDHLCREGILFNSTYAQCPICVPSRISIMTGKYVSTHGMDRNGESSDVMGRDGTLPTCLGKLGYQTAAIGKMHFGPQRVRHGFDEMILPDDYYRQMRQSGNPVQPMRHGLGQNELYPTMATVPENQTLTSWTAEQSVDYIRNRRDPSMPFFLWCSFAKPHPPFDPPEPYYSMYRNCPIPDPVFGDWSDDENCPEAIKRFRQRQSADLIPPEIIREARAAYYGLVTQIDYNMGRVFAALQEMDMFRDTLIVYTSDHGEFLGDHHCGNKIWFHEPSSRVPFVMRLPKNWDNRRHGTVVDALATHADILPTLVAAAGGTSPADTDGMDLIALARGEREAREYLDASCGLTIDLEMGYAALTDGRWKYIYYPKGSAEQLFDLQSDPMELKNLAGAAKHREKLEEMKAELVRRHQERDSEYIEDGKLISLPIGNDSETDRCDDSWPGYCSDTAPVDVRH